MNFAPRRYARKLFVGLVLLAADVLMFGTTDAGKVASLVLIVGFILLIATVYYLVYGLLSFGRLYGLPIKRKRRLAGSLAGLLGFIVALQSVGELNTRDVLVLLPLVVIGYAYSFYGAGSSKIDV